MVQRQLFYKAQVLLRKLLLQKDIFLVANYQSYQLQATIILDNLFIYAINISERAQLRINFLLELLIHLIFYQFAPELETKFDDLQHPSKIIAVKVVAFGALLYVCHILTFWIFLYVLF